MQTSFDLGQLKLLKVSRAFQNWTRVESNLNDKYSIVFHEKRSVTIRGV